MPLGIGIEEMIRAGVILVDAFLDQPHPEHVDVEIQILLCGSGDRSNMMKSSERLHRSFSRSLGFGKKGNFSQPTDLVQCKAES